MYKQTLQLLVVLAFVTTLAYGSTRAEASIRTLTVPFGGRVLSTKIPGVTCEVFDGGKAPVLLSSNLAGLGSAVSSGINSQQSTLQKVNNIGSGIYRAIPLYTVGDFTGGGFTGGKKQPKPGDWILGRQSLIPNFTTCQFGEETPFPVVKTETYAVSGNSGF